MRVIPLPEGYSALADARGFKGIAYNGKMLDVNTSASLDTYIEKTLNSKRRAIIKAKHLVTNRCNQRCYYCYARGLTTKKFASIDLSMKIMSRLRDFGVFLIQFQGGEPTLYPDFLDLLNYSDSIGMLTFFFTNGSTDFWRKKQVCQVFKRMETKPEIRVSLLAGEEKLHDELSGLKGSYNRSIETLQMLSDLACDVSISLSLTSKSYDQFRKVKELAMKFGCKLSIITEYYSNICGNVSGDDIIADEQILRARTDAFGKAVRELNGKDCSNGVASITIDSFGNVLGCERNQCAGFGNILEEELDAIVRKAPFQKIMRDYFKRPDECSICRKDLKDYCIWCPAIPANLGLTKDQWRTYHCESARKRRLFWAGH